MGWESRLRKTPNMVVRICQLCGNVGVGMNCESAALKLVEIASTDNNYHIFRPNTRVTVYIELKIL